MASEGKVKRARVWPIADPQTLPEPGDVSLCIARPVTRKRFLLAPTARAECQATGLTRRRSRRGEIWASPYPPFKVDRQSGYRT